MMRRLCDHLDQLLVHHSFCDTVFRWFWLRALKNLAMMTMMITNYRLDPRSLFPEKDETCSFL